MKPVWPIAEGDSRVPHDDVGSIVSHPSARELPGTSVSLMNVRIVSGLREDRLAGDGAQHRAGERADRGGRAEEPRVARRAAKRPRVLVVDLADQQPSAPLVDFGRGGATRHARGGLNLSGSAVTNEASRWNCVAKPRDEIDRAGGAAEAGPDGCASSRMNPSSMNPRSL